MPEIPRELFSTLSDRYAVDRELGRGGMGAVYLADDLKHRRKVAVKVMLPRVTEAIGRERFLREIDVAARLVHPHILPLYDSGSAGDLLYYVTPYIAGESLRARLDRERQLPIDDVLRLAREIAGALGYAHEQGVVHRDIKPENILLAEGIALVADFGIARVLLTPASRTPPETLSGALTPAGAILGTPRYMAPEQMGEDAVDGRADLYALACVLYEMLAGEPPYSAPTAAELLRQHLASEPRSLTELRPAVPASLATAIARAMSKRPADRPLSAARFAEALAVNAFAETTTALVPPVSGHVPTNLPRHRTPFVGRETELAECARQLGETRLFTVTGIGGCGKTRLASRLAERLVDRFPDGVWFVDLAPVKDPDHVVLTAASSVGVKENPGVPPLDALASHLASRRTLLVLDNCEHVLGASSELADHLLSECSLLTIMATSREALGVSGERPFALQPLTVPAASTSDVAVIGSADAVRLFVDRARVSDPAFGLSEASAPIIAEICRRLDGIPLAIELAAARIKVLSPEQVRSKLHDRFRLLTGGNRTALPRHQTLRAAIRWSYDQLTPGERDLLHKLSVFAGGWTLSSATRVSGEAADEFDTLDTLARLVDKSLVVVERTSGEARYGFLETVRQFAQELLAESGDAEETRRRHLAWFVERAESAYDERIRREEHWAPILEAEHENLRAALEFARGADAERYLQLCGALAWFWRVRSHLLEGDAHLQAALAMTAEDPPRPARARALWGAARIIGWRGDRENAVPLMQRSLEMWRTIGEPGEIAIALEGVGYALWLNGRDEDARDTFRECLALQRTIGDPAMINSAMVGLAQLHVALGELVEARALSHQILAYGRSTNDRRSEHFAAHYLADCALIEGSYEAALAVYRESLRLAHALGDRVETCFEIQGVAMALAGLGRHLDAIRLFAAVDAESARMDVDVHVRFWDQLLARFGAMARGRVSPGEIEQARAEGRTLGFEGAVRVAAAE